MKDSKLIAEFMGIESINAKMRGHLYECPVTSEYVTELEYHTSWDWLMPVVEKCLVGEAEQSEEISNTIIKNIYEGICNQDISFAYKSVVEFIKDCEEKKVIVKDLHGLDDNTISKIETPMFLIGDWFEDETTFADLRNSKGQVVRIFHERLEDYEKKSLIHSLDS